LHPAQSDVAVLYNSVVSDGGAGPNSIDGFGTESFGSQTYWLTVEHHRSRRAQYQRAGTFDLDGERLRIG
jgi:hypothetical protein